MVRCPGCSAPQSEWAPLCDRCGADLADAAPVSAPRQRRLRPRGGVLWMAGVLVVGLAIAALTNTFGSHHSASGSSAASIPAGVTPAATPITVVTVDPLGELVGFDLRSGTRRVLARDAAGWPEGPVTVSDQAFYISGGNAFTASSPSPLGSADSLVPVNGLQELWATPSSGAGAQVASLFHVQDGWALVTQADVDPGETPVAAGPSRLAAVRDGDIVIRDANTGRVTGTVGPVKHSYDVVGASGDTLVYVHNGQCDVGCSLALFDMTAAAATLLPAPAGTSGFIGGGAVSSTGDIAAFVSLGPASGQAELVIDNVDGVRVISVPFDVEEPVGAAAWDPTGRWVVFGGPRATYLLDTATMRTTLLPFTAGYSFTVLAA